MKKWITMLVAFCVIAGVLAMPMEVSFSYSQEPAEARLPRLFAWARAREEETVPATVYTEPPTVPAPETQPPETLPPETLPPETTAPEETEPPRDPSLDRPAEFLNSDTRGTNGVPLYFQTDYPNNMYGMGTIANNGCSAASLAMVASYLTGYEYLPDEIARYFGGAAENNIARLEEGSRVMKLPFKKTANWHETLAEMRKGKIAIALVDADSPFTDSQHFIVLTGFNEKGRIMVNDSYEPNYDKWDTEVGLKEGFLESEILKGYSGAWVYDKSAMPAEPFLYSEPLPVRGEPRYGIELTWEEYNLLARVVWVEARGESEEGQQAVAEVILNRLVSDRFQDTLKGVIYADNQFKSAKFLDKAEPYQLQYEMVENALYGPYILPDDVYYFATTAKTPKVWGRIGGHVFCYAND